VARRARTGDIVLCEPSSRDSVFIAGDFSDWQLHALSRSTRNSWQFGAFFEACVFHPNCTAFKFVMNRDLWIEPATFAENVIDAGVGDPSIQNLTLSLCENVVERGHRGDR